MPTFGKNHFVYKSPCLAVKFPLSFQTNVFAFLTSSVLKELKEITGWNVQNGIFVVIKSFYVSCKNADI